MLEISNLNIWISMNLLFKMQLGHQPANSQHCKLLPVIC